MAAADASVSAQAEKGAGEHPIAKVSGPCASAAVAAAVVEPRDPVQPGREPRAEERGRDAADTPPAEDTPTPPPDAPQGEGDGSAGKPKDTPTADGES